MASYGTMDGTVDKSIEIKIEMPRLHVDVPRNHARPVKWETPPSAPGFWRSRRRMSMVVLSCVFVLTTGMAFMSTAPAIATPPEGADVEGSGMFGMIPATW